MNWGDGKNSHLDGLSVHLPIKAGPDWTVFVMSVCPSLSDTRVCPSTHPFEFCVVLNKKLASCDLLGVVALIQQHVCNVFELFVRPSAHQGRTGPDWFCVRPSGLVQDQILFEFGVMVNKTCIL